MSVELKIKSKTLAVEAGYIRREERKTLRNARWQAEHQEAENSAMSYRQYLRLQDHRTKVLRPEARATHLARAFLKGTPYRQVENKNVTHIPAAMVEKIFRMVRFFGGFSGGEYTKVDVQAWLAEK